MSDLIDRQELLRQIDIDSDGEPGYYGDTWKFIDTIKRMPSAELSTNLAEVGTDCISRQAAIDLLKQMRKDGNMIPWEGKDVFARIRKLPPAQPEIIRCKDCKNWMPYDWMFSDVWQSKNMADYPEDEIGCIWYDMAMKSDDFCSCAVRREVQDENDKTTNNTTNA